MHYPDTVLSELEREPIVYWGCTWTEIMRATLKGLSISFMATVVLIILPTPISKLLLIIPFIGIWVIVTRRTLNKISKLRVGKPLFYERHVTLVKKPGLYIDPESLKQCERNRNTHRGSHA